MDKANLMVDIDIDLDEYEESAVDVKGSILLVEDDEGLNRINKMQLQKVGHTVYTAKNLQEARERLKTHTPDVILLDVELPDGNGFDFCGEIPDHIDSYVIFVTGRKEQLDFQQGIDSGGDMYMKKPYKSSELLGNVKAALRRRNRSQNQSLTKGELVLNLKERKAYHKGILIPLSQTEFTLLNFFAENEDKLQRAETIYQKVWGLDFAGDKNTLQATISNLRKKLEQTAYSIETKRGQGYCFQKY